MLALQFRKHPGGLSSMMFAFAALVIHRCGVSLPFYFIRLTSGIVIPVSSARLTLTPTLTRPLRIVTCLLSMVTMRRSRRKYVLTMVSGIYTRIRLAKIASSFFLLRCAVCLFYSTGIITYVYCHFACSVNMPDPDHIFSSCKYIAKRLFEINERGTYQDPSMLTPDKRTRQDEEIFQTARLVNCGWFGFGESR